MTGEPETSAGQPPRAVLFGFYLLLFIVLVTVLVVVGVYGT